MTRRHFRDILMRMKVAFTALVMALASVPALAAESAFDLGFARPGMTLADFRAFGWPTDVSVRCSGEDDLPPESETVRLAVPRPIAKLGGLRCGLFSHDQAGWHPYGLELAGNPSEIWGKFFPDRDGIPRLVQLVIKQPPQGFAALADHFTTSFGPPGQRDGHLARWESGDAEATIIEDGSKSLLAFIIDTRLQAALNARMTHQPGAKAVH